MTVVQTRERAPQATGVARERATAPPPRGGASHAAAVLALQRSAGNRAIASLLAARPAAPGRVDRCPDMPGRACGCGHKEADAAIDADRKQVGGRCACGGTLGAGGECSRCLSRRGRLARQASDAPRQPILNPSDPRLAGALEDIARGPGKPGGAHTRPPPWMPHTRNPLPIHLGEGTRRHPKLKDEGAPGGAGCRGACGPDCPSTCKVIGTYVERYEIGGTHYTIEFPDALLCGTHAGCRLHDNCFDGAVAGGEVDMGGPKHVACNWEALIKYGRSNTTSWARGGGPYDDWWYFVDSPRVVESSKAKRTAP